MKEICDSFYYEVYKNRNDIYNWLNCSSELEEFQEMISYNCLSDVSVKDNNTVMVIIDERNKVISEAYSDRNLPLTATSIYVFNYYFAEYIDGAETFMDFPMVSFNSLDPLSKYMVLVIGESILSMYPYDVEVDGKIYQYSELMERIMTQRENIYNQLCNAD